MENNERLLDLKTGGFGYEQSVCSFPFADLLPYCSALVVHLVKNLAHGLPCACAYTCSKTLASIYSKTTSTMYLCTN